MKLDWKRTRKVIGVISATLLLGSIFIGVKWGRWEGFDPKKWYKVMEAIVLGVWILIPPIWFWVEYFFLYKDEATSKVKLDEFKHGQDQSAKIWLALVTLLAGLYFGKDLVREPGAQGTQQSSSNQQNQQQSQSSPSSGASVSRPPAATQH